MSKVLFTGIVFLCTLFDGGAQPNVAALSQKFEAYQSAWPKTRLYLAFNQEKFSPGDTAWFKAYFLTENLTGIAGKQLIDLTLVNSRGESRVRFMFNVNNGLGHNQLAIPDTLSAGIYFVTAYSSWMKNFDPAFIFKKKIVIVRKNTLVPDEKPVLVAVAEGGHLVRDVSNKVSIRTGKPGSAVQIIDAGGQEIARTSTDGNGMASVIFKPIRNASYFAQLTGESARAPLPPTEDDGCSLLLTPAGKEEPVKIIITSPPASMLRNEELVLIVSSRGKIYHTATVLQGTKDGVALQLPQDDLPEGIAHVSLLNHAGNVLASRDFYCQGEAPVQANILANKHYFQTREKVKLEVSLMDSKGRPVEGEFAIDVLNAGLFDLEKQNSISDELNILSGRKERFMIDRSDANWLSDLDNHLISATEDVPWKEIVSEKGMKPRFPFGNGVRKSGRAYYADSGKPVPDLADIQFYFQRSRIRYKTTVEKGKVLLPIPDLYGPDELFYLAETSFYFGETKHGEDIPDLKIEWDDEPITLPHSPLSKEIEGPDRYASFVANSRLINRSYGFYTSPEDIGSGNSSRIGSSDFEKEIKGADITINVQDYILFPTMAELVKEVIPSLQHRKTKGKSTVHVTLPERMWDVSSGEPVYIIDGIATKNTAFFLSLKPPDVLTVKIVYRTEKLLPLGLMGNNGIVIVQTKKGDAREPLDDPAKLIEGLNRPLDFADDIGTGPGAIRTRTRDPHRPDFRSTIYWNPSVTTDSNGKATVEFFCSDDIGKLRLRVDGLATGGRPFSAWLDLEVGIDPDKK